MWSQFALNVKSSLLKKRGDRGKETIIFHFFTAIYVLICFLIAPNSGAAANKNNVEIQALNKKVVLQTTRNSTLSSVLEEKDLSLYGQIFKLQEKGDWAAAKNLIKKLIPSLQIVFPMDQNPFHLQTHELSHRRQVI